MTVTRNFLGIPIDGDITDADKRVEQRPLSELEPLVRAVLDDPAMHSFGWTQYTPYFNDGEPCVFSVGKPWFRTVADAGKVNRHDDEDDDEEDCDPEEDDYMFVLSGYRSGHPSLGKRDGVWDPDTREYRDTGYVGPDEARYDRVRALSDAIEGGAFDDVLLEAFGDHARIVVTATGITVDSYDHD